MTRPSKPHRFPETTDSYFKILIGLHVGNCNYLQASQGTYVQVLAGQVDANVGYAVHVTYCLNRIFPVVVNKGAAKSKPDRAHVKNSGGFL
jgi:hypothetical protein